MKNILTTGICGIILGSLLLTTPVFADGESNQTNTDTKQSLTTTLDKALTIEQQTKAFIGRRFYSDRPLNVYKSLDSTDLIQSDSQLSVGRYYHITDSKILGNFIYFQVSLASDTAPFGYVRVDENILDNVLRTDYLTFVSPEVKEKSKKGDTNKYFYQLLEPTGKYSERYKNNSRRHVSSDIVEKDVLLNVLEEETLITDKDAIGWYQVKDKKTFETLKDAETFVQDSGFEIKEVSQTINQDNTSDENSEPKKTYEVEISGWINQSPVKDVAFETSDTGKITVNHAFLFTKNTTDDNDVQLVIDNSELTFVDYFVEKRTTVSNWYKVEEIDDNGKVLSDTYYLLNPKLSESTYTTIEKEHSLDKQLMKVTKDVDVWLKPVGSKNNKKVKTLKKDDYFYSNKLIVTNDLSISGYYNLLENETEQGVVLAEDSEVVVEKKRQSKLSENMDKIDEKIKQSSDDKDSVVIEDNKESEYYSVLDDKGEKIGVVDKNSVQEIVGNKVVYTVQENETLKDVLSKFQLSEKDFNNMNIELVFLKDVPFSKGLEVIVKQDEIIYNTTNVRGVQSGINLINELKYTAPIINNSGIKASVAYGQALLESANGTSGLSTRSNNLFGIKGTYKGQGSSWSTQEDSGGGSMYTINSTFRTYPNKMVSVLDYRDLIVNSGIYNRAIGLDTAEETIDAIWRSGYATDSSYTAKVMDMINRYDLKQFDNYK